MPLKSSSKRKPPEKLSITAHLKKVWIKYGSRYFRMKDARERGDGEIVKCVTCSKVDHWKNFDGGHFIPRRYLHAYLADRNAHCQCFSCNVMKSGNFLEYEDFILDTYGEKELKRLKDLRYSTEKITHEWISEREQFFKNELIKMQQGDTSEYDSFLRDF